MNQIELNQQKALGLFKDCKSNEDVYKTLISLGINTPNLEDKDKIEENRVHGCQSQLYIIHHGTKDAVFFKTDSDALISKGLAGLLTNIYSGASAEEILKTPLTIFKKIDILSILSPTRVTGLDGLEKKMKQLAINYLL